MQVNYHRQKSKTKINLLI